MDMRLLKIGALALVSSPLLSACTPSVASMSCDAMAQQAQQLSQSQSVKVTAISGLRETSRNENEARCEGEGTLQDGSNVHLYLRAYKEGDNTMVAYQNQPF